MGFIMDGLDAEAYDRTYGDRVLLRRVVRYFRPKLPLMVFIATMVVLASVADAGLNLLLAEGINQLEGSIDAGPVAWIVGAILLAGAVSWTTNFLRQRYTARAVGDVVLTLRRDAFKAVVARDMSFYDEFPSGRIVSRVTSDTEEFASVVTLTLSLLSQLLLFVLVTGILVYVNFRLSLFVLAMAPVIVGISLAFRRYARLSTQRAQRSMARVNANVQEAVAGIAVAKAFRQEARVYDEFTRVNQQAYGATLRSGFIYNGVFPVLVTVAATGTAVVVYFGGRGVLSGDVSAGHWFLFVQSINLFWFPLTSIASFWSQFQLGLAAAERVFALIDAEPRVVQTGNDPAPRLRGRIEFRDLDFSYSPRQRVLTGFNLTIEAGEAVAFVGHTGAGKSTIGRLVARFYEFQRGELLVDGLDIRAFDLATYRRQLGVVPQAPFLFSGTIADNIRYAQPEASDAEVAAVARQVGGGDWLDALPEGLATEVGEAGRGLSMGQRQLVALARVLLQSPAIVIMDEATASVDPLTEAQIQEGLDTVLAGRTAIVIAHRLSTIRGADRIIVLREGRIVEEGSHDLLMLRGGHYADLYNTYFRHQSPDYRPGEGFVPVRVPASTSTLTT
jgi:ABC-type multidrug transport system fused ATPase/permease subunit